MATVQRVSQSSLGASPSNYGLSEGSGNGGGEAAALDQFPAGLRVLVVDDDTACLRIIEQMLRRCLYHVTLCSQAAVALNLLREKKGCFDVVLSDVHMPDMDGYKLLEDVGLEMDLPVIMMSADKRTSAVMKGIRHGACDYLIKPIREEELKNIWQHVVRKKWNEYKELENSESLVENDKQIRGTDDAECASSAHEEEGIKRDTRKRSTSKDDDDEPENDDPSASKKPRVVWSVELHQQFVIAVNQLGLDKAVPKRILELMNVPGLTRENVASHLQKFRLFLKRLSGVAHQQNAISNIYCGPLEQNVNFDAFGGETMAVSGQISPQTLAALHAELLGRSMCNLRPSMDQLAVLQGPLRGTKLIADETVDRFSQTLAKCQTSNSKNYLPSVISVDCVTSGYNGACPPNRPGFVLPNNLGRMSSQNANMLVGTLQPPQQQNKQYEQQQEQKQHPQQQLMSSEPSCSITVQPSCLVLPSPSSVNVLVGNIPEFPKQNHNISSGTIIDYSIAPSQRNFNQTDGDRNPHNATSGYLTQMYGSSGSFYLSNDANNSVGHVEASRLASPGGYLPGVSLKTNEIKGFYGSKSEETPDQGHFRRLVLVGKGSSSQTHLPVGEIVSPMTNEHLDQWKNYMPYPIRKNQEPLIKYAESTEVGFPIQRVLQ